MFRSSLRRRDDNQDAEIRRLLRHVPQPPGPEPAPAAPPAAHDDLLAGLLQEALPSRAERPTRPALRTVEEERRIALRPFLLKTWVDRALAHTERLLAVAAIGVFGFWVADGPARDALHRWSETRPAALVAAAARESSLAAERYVAATREAAREAERATTRAAALPFTPPGMAPERPRADFLAPQSLPARPALASDPRPQRLRIPSLSLDSVVAEVYVVDGAWQVADYAVGYHHGTALPGSPGNTVMAGHAGIRGAVFRDLPALRQGDPIEVQTTTWHYTYRVREVKSVWPTQVEVMDPTPSPVLTLITCTDWDTRRLIVVADLVDARPLT